MSDIIVCRSCGTVVEPTPGQKPVTLRLDEKGTRDVDLRRLFLVVCYVLAAAGVAAFFILGVGFNAKSSIFFWPTNEVGQSFMRYVDEKCLPAVFFPLMVVVGGAFVAVRLRALVLGIIIAAAVVGGYYGVLQVKKDLDWANIGWFYSALAAALLAVLVGLIFSRRWLVLAWFIVATTGLAFLGRYFNEAANHAFAVEWAPFFAGVFHGLLIGVAARLAGWIMNRGGASVLLGAFVGGFLGMFIADHDIIRELQRTPEFRGIQLPFVSLYLEGGLAFVLALVTSLLGKRAIASSAGNWRGRPS